MEAGSEIIKVAVIKDAIRIFIVNNMIDKQHNPDPEYATIVGMMVDFVYESLEDKDMYNKVLADTSTLQKHIIDSINASLVLSDDHDDYTALCGFLASNTPGLKRVVINKEAL